MSAHTRVSLAVRIMLIGVLCFSANAQQTMAKAAPVEAEKKAAPSKADIQQSKELLQRAIRLASNRETMPAAFGLLEESTALNPADTASITAREFVRQELVAEHMERGNALMENSQPTQALDEFRQALALDASNAYATQRVNDATAMTSKKNYAPPIFDFGSEPELKPKAGKQNFTMRGDTRQLITTIARAFGLTVTFDVSFSPHPTKVDLQNVDFQTAMDIACKLSKCFYIADSAKEMIVANDTQDTRRNLERVSVKSFYIPSEAGAQQLPEISNIVRQLLELRYIATDASQNTLTIRAPKKTLEAAQMIIDTMTGARPQVLLEVRVMRLDENSSKQIGINYPLQFTMFNLNTEAAKLGPNGVDILNRIRAGTVTPQDLAAIGALIASGTAANSPFLQGFATIGGGLFQTGIVIPPASVSFSASHSLFQNIEHVTLRASQGQAANLHIGDRYPVLTGTFTSTLSGIPGLPTQQNAQPIVPSISYEDLGITLKATTQVTMTSDVTMSLDLSIKALGATTLNSIPTISNRQYTGTITVRDGETSLLAGTVDRTDTKTISGLPWLSSLPGFGRAFSNTGTNSTSDQMIILVTPHILQMKVDPSRRTDVTLDPGT